jgi:hypothetical protein
VRVLAVYAATRTLTFLLFLITAANQGDNYWTKANPGYFDFLNIWDVEWYGKIYARGYPTVLPLTENGTVQQNEWAFMPGFPTTVHAFDFLGVEWKFIAPILATIFGACFALVAFRIFAAKLNDHQSLWAVGLFLLSPASPVLQTGYAESLGLLLLALAVFAWISDRFWLAILAMVAGIGRSGARLRSGLGLSVHSGTDGQPRLSDLGSAAAWSAVGHGLGPQLFLAAHCSTRYRARGCICGDRTCLAGGLSV